MAGKGKEGKGKNGREKITPPEINFWLRHFQECGKRSQECENGFITRDNLCGVLTGRKRFLNKITEQYGTVESRYDFNRN